MNTTLVAVHNQPTPARALLWLSDNLGLGEKDEDCLVTVKEDGRLAHWSITQTLDRLSEFSERARAMILVHCRMQLEHS